MFTNPVAAQIYTKSFSFDPRRSDKTRYESSRDERDKDKSKPEEEEKRPGDLAVA